MSRWFYVLHMAATSALGGSQKLIRWATSPCDGCCRSCLWSGCHNASDCKCCLEPGVRTVGKGLLPLKSYTKDGVCLSLHHRGMCCVNFRGLILNFAEQCCVLAAFAAILHWMSWTSGGQLLHTRLQIKRSLRGAYKLQRVAPHQTGSSVERIVWILFVPMLVMMGMAGGLVYVPGILVIRHPCNLVHLLQEHDRRELPPCRPKSHPGEASQAPLLPASPKSSSFMPCHDLHARPCPVHVICLALSASERIEITLVHSPVLSVMTLPYVRPKAQAVTPALGLGQQTRQTPYMVERIAGTGSSSEDEYMDARMETDEGEEPSRAEVMAERPPGEEAAPRRHNGSTSGHRPNITTERIMFDRLGQRVREPPGPPPAHTRPTAVAEATADADADAAMEEESSGRLTVDYVSSGSSVELPPGAPPRGPPPPVPLQYTEAAALRVASALRQALQVVTGKVLVMIPPNWEQLTQQGVTLTLRAMSPGEQYHPHVMHFSDGPTACPTGPTGPEGPSVPEPDPGRAGRATAGGAEAETETAAAADTTPEERRKQALKRAWNDPDARTRMTEAEVEEFLLDLDYDQLLSTLEEPPATHEPEQDLEPPSSTPVALAADPSSTAPLSSLPASSIMPATSGSTTGMSSGSAGDRTQDMLEAPVTSNTKSQPHLLVQFSFAGSVKSRDTTQANYRVSALYPGATAETARSESGSGKAPHRAVIQVAEPRNKSPA